LRTSSDTAASIGLLLCFWQSGGAIYNGGDTMDISASEFIDNTAVVSDLVCMHNLFLCYSSNALLRTSSDTAASIGLLLCFWYQ
jgi:hypothetical protein